MPNDKSPPPSPPHSQPPGPPAIRLGQCLNSLLKSGSHHLAAEKAVHAFLRPPRLQPTPTQLTLLSTATQSTILVSGIFITTYTWTPRRAFAHTVLLSHGFGTSAATMTSLIPLLLAANLRVIACDHCGHGSSAGEWGNLNIFASTIQALARLNAPLAGIIGHSAGATMAVIALAQNPEIHCPRLVCLSPPMQTVSLAMRFLQSIGVTEDLAAEMQLVFDETGFWEPGVVRRALAQPMKGIGAGRTTVLVVQDRDDKVVPVRDAEELAQAVEGARLEMTRGLGHQRGLSDPHVVRLATGFVLEDSVDSLSKL